MRVILTSLVLIPYLISLYKYAEPGIDSTRPYSAKSDSVRSDTLVQMERTICFGTCPSYELTIQKDGSVTFVGKEFVQQEGRREATISETNMEELMKAIQKSHFMEIPSSPECQSRMTDHPSVFLTIELDGQRNSVTHYHGCKGFEYEDELYDLEETIDSLAGVKKWVEGE